MARIQTTPMVKMALYFLRVYLIILLILILIAFIRKSQAGSSAKPTGLPLEAPQSATDRNSAL
jgi:hypothetical protein